MVNSVLYALPTHYMCTLKLPKKLISHVDRDRRHCLRRKIDEVAVKSHSLAAWDLVNKPKGLGIINLEVQNISLHMKQLDKFFNKAYLP